MQPVIPTVIRSRVPQQRGRGVLPAVALLSPGVGRVQQRAAGRRHGACFVESAVGRLNNLPNRDAVDALLEATCP